MSQLPSGWVERKDASGQKYYFNMTTQESTLIFPGKVGFQQQNIGNPFYDEYSQGYQPPKQQYGGGYQELEGDISLNREAQHNLQNQQKFGVQVNVKQNQLQQQTLQGNEDKPSGWRLWCSIQIFNEYFQVNTKDISQRLKYSLFFWSNEFQQITQSNPDIYGPFWIFTTLIFIISVMGNLSRYFSNIENDPSYVLKAASLFYIMGFSVPIVLCLILKLFGSQMKVGHYICIYGYSFTIFVPVCFLEAIPNAMLQIFILMIGGGIQICFLIRNFESELENYIQNKKWVGIGILVTIQVLLLFAYKAYFADEVFVEERPHIEQLRSFQLILKLLNVIKLQIDLPQSLAQHSLVNEVYEIQLIYMNKILKEVIKMQIEAPYLDEDEMQQVYNWVDEIPLSRPKKNIARDFSDGVLLAEMTHHFFPKMVELHNYSSANSLQQKNYNWNTLNCNYSFLAKVYKKMGFMLCKSDIENCVNCVNGAIERVLKLVQNKMAAYANKVQNKVSPNESNYVQQAPQTSNIPGNIQQPYQQADVRKEIDSGMLAEKEQTIQELKETIEIMELKIKKLEQLVRLKDSKIQNLTNKLAAAGVQ